MKLILAHTVVGLVILSSLALLVLWVWSFWKEWLMFLSFAGIIAGGIKLIGWSFSTVDKHWSK